MAKRSTLHKPFARKRNAPADHAPKMDEPARERADAEHQDRLDRGWRFDPDQGPPLDLRAETLTGDIRDVLMAQIEDMKVGWTLLPEQDQRRIVNEVEASANLLVRRVIQLMLEFEFPWLRVSVGEWKVKKPKDGAVIEVRLSMPMSEPNGSKLLHHDNGQGILVLADHKAFVGERKPFPVQPDQSDMLPPEGDTQPPSPAPAPH